MAVLLKSVAVCLLVIFCTAKNFAGIYFSSKESGINLVGGKLSISNSGVNAWDGTLSTSSERNITSGIIDFNTGRLVVNNVPAIVSGRLQAAVSQQLQLLGSQMIRIDAGPFPARLYVSGLANRFEGQPVFTIEDSVDAPNITVASGGELVLSLQNACNSFIKLDSGTALLDDDFHFSDKREFIGNGTVVANYKMVSFGGADVVFTGTTRFVGPAGIEFNSNARLSSLWYIGTDDLSREINITGNGNILDLSLGGTISISPGVKVALSNMKIKGIGKGGIAFGSTTSQLKLSDVQLELDQNYSVTCGNIYVNGDVTFVTKDKYFTFAHRGTLTVDGVSLWYDSGKYEQNNNIRPVSTVAGASANVFLKNGGFIKFVPTQASGDLLVSGESITLKTDKDISVDSKLVLVKNKTVIDGGGHTMTFAAEDGLISMPSAGRLVFKNVILKNFSPQHVDQSQNQSICFGDNTVIHLAPTKTDRAAGSIVLPNRWFFTGKSNALLDGNGNTLDISSNIHALSLISSGTLTLQNMKLYGLGGIYDYGNLRCMDRHGTINLKNIDLILTGDYTFFRGYLNIYPDVLIRGINKKFSYVSERPLSITDSASLTFDYGMTFSYDSRDLSSQKNERLQFVTDASTLYLNAAKIHATTVGLRISKGTIFADNSVTFASEGSSDENAFVVASRVNVHVLAAATLKLSGRVLLE